MNRDLTTSCKRCRIRRIRGAAAGSILGTVLILSALSRWDASAGRQDRPLFRLLTLGTDAQPSAPFGIHIALGRREPQKREKPRARKAIQVATNERNGPSRGRTRKS